MKSFFFSKILSQSDVKPRLRFPCALLSPWGEKFNHYPFQTACANVDFEGDLSMPTKGTFRFVMKTHTGQLSAKQFRKRKQEKRDKKLRMKLIRRLQSQVRKYQSQLSSLTSHTISQDQHTLFLELLPADVGNMEMTLEDSKKMSIELQKLKIEWEHSRKSQERMDRRMQNLTKMMEEYQSQVSSLISSNKSQNQHIHSLLLELREVYKVKEELRRGNVELKKQIEYLKDLKTQQQLVDFNCSDQVSRETGRINGN